MPFLCSRGLLSFAQNPNCSSVSLARNQKLKFDFSGWAVQWTEPSQTNLKERNSHEPLVLLDGYLSNRNQLLATFPGSESDEHSDAVLIGRYLALNPQTTPSKIKGCIFLCALFPGHVGRMALFRDRLGGRTGYWHHTSNLTIAGSHASEIARLSQGSFTPDPEFTASCFSLTGRPPVSHSAFSGITELQPGEHVSLIGTTLKTSRTPACERQALLPNDPTEQANEFRRLLDQSIQNSLRNQRGVAAMVSGGMDSGPMTVIADRILSLDGRAVLPISWHLPHCQRSDERRWVELLESYVQQPIHYFDGSDLSPFGSISKDQVSPEAPLWNPCRPLIDHCYSVAAEHGCSIILNGNAGDLLYPERAWLFLDTLHRAGLSVILNDFFWIVRHYGWKAALRDPALRRLLARKLGVDEVRRVRQKYRPRTIPWLTKKAHQYLVEESWPPEADEFSCPEHFRKVFGQTMAFGRAHEQPYALKHGLERRDPYQDEDLAAFMVALPFKASHFKDQTKHIARLAAVDLLPDRLRKKRRTGDLTPLITEGMKKHRDRIKESLKTSDAWMDWVRADAVEQALTEPKPTGHHMLLISQCLAYNLWLQHHSA